MHIDKKIDLIRNNIIEKYLTNLEKDMSSIIVKNKINYLLDKHKIKITPVSENDNQTSVPFNSISYDMFKIKWIRLPLIHKKMKLKEFVDNLDNNVDKIGLFENLITELENKNIKNKNVEYDIENGKIKDINIIKIDKKSNKFVIDIKKRTRER